MHARHHTRTCPARRDALVQAPKERCKTFHGMCAWVPAKHQSTGPAPSQDRDQGGITIQSNLTSADKLAGQESLRQCGTIWF